jgi:Xaa-Pro aminopeptidase
MFAIDSMPARAMETCRAAIEIHNTIIGKIKPGVALGDVFDLSVRMAGKLGYAQTYLGAPGHKVSFIGHGIGLEIIEPPIISRNRKDLLEPGMVFALEPKFVFENEFTAGVESVFQVTETGARTISRVPAEVFIC